MFCGFLLSYLTRTTELLLRRYTPRDLLQLDQILNLLYPFGCILSYHLLSNIPWLVSLNIALRIFNGFLGYPRCLLLIDLTRSQFGRQFDSVNSLIQMGVYAGHGLGAAAGSGLYDRFGYSAPFYLVAAMLLLPIFLTWAFVPDCPSYSVSDKGEETVLMQGEKTSEDQSRLYGSVKENEELEARSGDTNNSTGSSGSENLSDKPHALTPLILVPLVSTMLVNIVYGYLQITVTPYLNLEFGVSLSKGGLVLSTVSLGMVSGSLLSAYLMRGPRISPYTQMALGSVLVGGGILLMFPIKYITPLYKLSPYLAFPAAFLAGLGDPLITIATLSAMKSVQVRRAGKVTPDQEILIGGTWLIGFLAFCFAGQGVAGVMTEYLDYWVGGAVLCGMCAASFAISCGLYIKCPVS